MELFDRPCEDGRELVIRMSNEEGRALDFDGWQLTDFYTGALIGLVHLRGDTATIEQIGAALFEVTRRLEHRLEGIGDALIRRHTEMGGTYGQLAEAMGTHRSTAQSRREKVMGRAPDDWERWATNRNRFPAAEPASATDDFSAQRPPRP